jgi:hypothetical protein
LFVAWPTLSEVEITWDSSQEHDDEGGTFASVYYDLECAFSTRPELGEYALYHQSFFDVTDDNISVLSAEISEFLRADDDADSDLSSALIAIHEYHGSPRFNAASDRSTFVIARASIAAILDDGDCVDLGAVVDIVFPTEA